MEMRHAVPAAEPDEDARFAVEAGADSDVQLAGGVGGADVCGAGIMSVGAAQGQQLLHGVPGARTEMNFGVWVFQ